MKLNISIVALTHNDIKDNYVEYAHSAAGRQLKLVHAKQNEMDPMAVKAYDGKLFLGYVAFQDLEDVHAALRASGKSSLRAHCLGFHAKEDGVSGMSLEAVTRFHVDGEKEILSQYAATLSEPQKSNNPSFLELEVSGGKIVSLDLQGEPLPMPDALRQAYSDVYDNKPFTDWHYSGPLYPIDRLERIEDCTVMLQDAMKDIFHARVEAGLLTMDEDGRRGNHCCADSTDMDELEMLNDDMKEQLADFMDNHYFDYSHEMTLARKHVQTLLVFIGEKEYERERKALQAGLGYISSSSYRGKAAHCFFVDTPISLQGKNVGVYDYSDRLDEIEAELEAFPYDMYRKFKADPVDLLRQIYYKHVPRQQMIQLLSGIILMIMHRRVGDVKRWGKHNDEFSLQEMKELRHIGKATAPERADGEARREIADLCVQKMAYLYNPRSYKHLVHSQADWYPVFRVMAGLGFFDKGDHKAFAEYLPQVLERAAGKMPSGDSISSEGDSEKTLAGGTSSAEKSLPFELTDEMEMRPRVPVCKKKDLDQAAESIFDKTEAWAWESLSDEDVAGIQRAKFNRYCDIVSGFCKLLREEESLRGVSAFSFQ